MQQKLYQKTRSKAKMAREVILAFSSADDAKQAGREKEQNYAVQKANKKPPGRAASCF
ncbi:MAG: hypothetical protein WC783_03595 [Candidatus Paceibacterota bacterium]|jgi:hypothetical protein